MSEQVFVDTEKQLIVALSPERLTYNPVGEAGWHCRLDEIAWTSSDIDPRGLREVRLHAADGRIAAVIPEFEQIARFYLSLLKALAARPFFDAARPGIPTRVDLMERVLWLAGRTGAADGAWQALQAEDGGIVVAAYGGLLLVPPPGTAVERIPWPEFAGAARREDSPVSPYSGTRFYTASSWVELPLSELRPDVAEQLRRRREELAARGEAPRFAPPGVTCPDPALAMRFSWEIEAARRDELFEQGEPVLACAYGRGRLERRLPSASAVEAARLAGAITGLSRQSAPLPSRTVLFLTARRLLITERSLPDDELLESSEVGVGRAPRLRRAEGALFMEDLELLTDPAVPTMAADFAARYREWVRAGLRDPFSPELEPAFR